MELSRIGLLKANASGVFKVFLQGFETRLGNITAANFSFTAGIILQHQRFSPVRMKKLPYYVWMVLVSGRQLRSGWERATS